MAISNESKVLSRNDGAVLSQIFDPESAPSAGIIVDENLNEDPHYPDPDVWDDLKRQEKMIILRVESILKDKRPLSSLQQEAENMQALIDAYPSGACLLNDYAQILRLQYGNDLVSGAHSDSLMEVFQALDKAIALLRPAMTQAAVSPAQGRTLAQVYTQRGALLHGLANIFSKNPTQTIFVPALGDLNNLDLQEAASKDFFMGGRYGNEVSKALAVHINPTAKLCGQIVKNAMSKEFSAT